MSEQLGNKIAENIKKIQSLVLFNSKSKQLNKKYNLRVLNDPDPDKLISEIISLINKEDYSMGYVFEPNFFQQIPAKYNGMNIDVKKGTDIDIHVRNNNYSSSLGYYSFLFYLYRYIALYCGRLLKHHTGRRSLTYGFLKDILNMKFIGLREINHVLELFNTIVLHLDGSNNSPVILISKNALDRDLPIIKIDEEVYKYLKQFSFTDKQLIKENFKINQREVKDYCVLSTTTLQQLIKNAQKFVSENSEEIENHLKPPQSTKLKGKKSHKKHKKHKPSKKKKSKKKGIK